MHPILFEFGSIAIPSWHFFFSLSAILSLYFFRFLLIKTHKDLINKGVIFFIVAYVSGVLCARLFSLVVEYETINFNVFSKFNSFTLLGGVIGGAFFGSIYLKINKIPLLVIGDLAGICLLFAVAIGRIGCFLNGDDYGIAYSSSAKDLWWTVSFPNHPTPKPRLPVQLIESFLVLIGSISLAYLLLKRKVITGLCSSLALYYYSIVRFFLEYYRGDYRGWIIKDLLSPAQLISILMFIFATLLMFKIIFFNTKDLTKKIQTY